MGWRNYNTLIACLPNKSKEILSEDGIVTSILASKPSMFNYAPFCKNLTVSHVYDEISKLLENRQSVSSQNLQNILVTQEIFKLLMNQIPSLKKLVLPVIKYIKYFKIYIVSWGKWLYKRSHRIHCYSDNDFELSYQLSQICHNMQSLNVDFYEFISNGLADLISVQQNLDLIHCDDIGGLTIYIITSLTNLPDTLIKLNPRSHVIPFIARLSNKKFDQQDKFFTITSFKFSGWKSEKWIISQILGK